MYDLLQGIRVLEVALLAPDALGMHLADLGAEVIKVEEPPLGDYVRVVGGVSIGGQSLLHLRWNRGKKSLGLSLKTEEGGRLFLDLAASAHVVVDGLRAGTMEGFGLGYEAVREVNPAIVYCSLNGAGQSGAYRDLATHGLAFDAYAGLNPPLFRDDGTPYVSDKPQVGLPASGLYAALGVTAALVKAVRTGQGRHIEVAALDCSTAWQGQIDHALNDVQTDFAGMEAAVRYQYYRAKDGKFIIFQASEDKFWRNFCETLGRDDLLQRGERRAVGDHARGDEELRRELAAIFATRTREEWVRFFIETNVPGGPVNTPEDLLDDPHFKSRDLVFEQDHPRAGRVRWFGTPIKVGGQRFDAAPAPSAGEHTQEVLSALLGLDEGRIAGLRRDGVVSE